MDDERILITLVLGEDDERECEVLAIYEVDGQEYIALEPVNSEDGNVYLYRYSEGEDGEAVLDTIEDDEEFNRAGAAFDDLCVEDDEYEEE